ncbi:50S ribosomal protein L2 [Candidatus Saccharibacteria bacterium]|nr:50S ribosomal protein L2 [Candidatus Saccharibacteria bacterium]MCB9821554.1 50S ribosomal protein L2 [Candidatus Nomurabacteria bacterium]
MAIKTHRPVTPGQRGMTTQDLSAITTKRPVKSLLATRKQQAGRNNRGVITSRRRGGGAKRHYRVMNWNLPEGFKATVEHIEYDPTRSARIARLKESTGKYHYIVAPKGLKQGATVCAGQDAPIELANRLPLKNIPTGTIIYSVEMIPGNGAQMVRSAGAMAQLAAKDEGYVQVKLPSGEVRRVHEDAQAHIGAVGNEQHQNVKLGKAGRSRHMSRRPKVRGVVMNPVDHPHGGGEARGKGYKAPTTPWGQKTLGYKTRARNKVTNKFIVRSRHAGKRK